MIKLNEYLKGVQNSNTPIFVKHGDIRIRARVIYIGEETVDLIFEGQNTVTGSTFQKRECEISTKMSFLDFEKAIINKFMEAY